MNNTGVQIILKSLAVIIIFIGVYFFIDLELWNAEARYEVAHICQIFLPIAVLGFSGTLYGIATIIESISKKK